MWTASPSRGYRPSFHANTASKLGTLLEDQYHFLPIGQITANIDADTVDLLLPKPQCYKRITKSVQNYSAHTFIISQEPVEQQSSTLIEHTLVLKIF